MLYNLENSTLALQKLKVNGVIKKKGKLKSKMIRCHKEPYNHVQEVRERKKKKKNCQRVVLVCLSDSTGMVSHLNDLKEWLIL